MSKAKTTKKSVQFETRTYVLKAAIFIIAVFIAIGVSALPTASKAGAEKAKDNMPTLSGDAAIEFLKKESTYKSLADAITSVADDERPYSPDNKCTGLKPIELWTECFTMDHLDNSAISFLSAAVRLSKDSL